MSKIQLSAEEMQLVNNSEWILTKQRVVEKVYAMFGTLSEMMQAYLQENKQALPAEVVQFSPKISKGEQYESLPYVVLDYPRVFSKEDVLAIRSFFWWGNYFSITLHVKGKYLIQAKEIINAELNAGKWEGYYFSNGGNEFDFNLAGKNYILINKPARFPIGEKLDAPFYKLSYTIPFSQWDSVGQELLDVFKRFIQLLNEA